MFLELLRIKFYDLYACETITPGIKSNDNKSTTPGVCASTILGRSNFGCLNLLAVHEVIHWNVLFSESKIKNWQTDTCHGQCKSTCHRMCPNMVVTWPGRLQQFAYVADPIAKPRACLRCGCIAKINPADSRTTVSFPPRGEMLERHLFSTARKDENVFPLYRQKH